jgi:hypothetical protein
VNTVLVFGFQTAGEFFAATVATVLSCILTEVSVTLTEVSLNLTEVSLNLTEVSLTLTESFLNLTEVSLTLTEGFPCFFLSCKGITRVKLVKTGHGPHSSTLVVICVVLLLCFYVLFVCTATG